MTSIIPDLLCTQTENLRGKPRCAGNDSVPNRCANQSNGVLRKRVINDLRRDARSLFALAMGACDPLPGRCSVSDRSNAGYGEKSCVSLVPICISTRWRM